jgi:hypothetical protein
LAAGKLLAVGNDDDGAFKFSFPTDLSAFPVDALHLCLRTARHVVGDLELEIARRSPDATSAVEPDRAVPLDEAVPLFGTTRSYLERKANYSKLGGFVDADGRVKFMLSGIRRHHQTMRRKAAFLS